MRQFACIHNSSPLFYFLDFVHWICLFKEWLERAITSEVGKPGFAGIGLNPVAFLASRCLRAEENIDRWPRLLAPLPLLVAALSNSELATHRLHAVLSPMKLDELIRRMHTSILMFAHAGDDYVWSSSHNVRVYSVVTSSEGEVLTFGVDVVLGIYTTVE